MPGGVSARLAGKTPRDRIFEVQLKAGGALRPAFGVWELEDFGVRGGRIYGRSCDDLIGVASILATLILLKRSRARVNVMGLISRAEEVGFQGALTVAASKRLPKDSLVISLETSKELPPVKMGGGVIIRVGDRASIFDSRATRYLHEVALKVQKRHDDFQFQRALMSGGACEATAFQEFGFQSAAVCVALGNYHNCGPGNRIEAEYVSLNDTRDMVGLLVSVARSMGDYAKLTQKLPNRLRKLLEKGRRKLRITNNLSGCAECDL
jgi:endoglucanase